jgi:hypothetical protein
MLYDHHLLTFVVYIIAGVNLFVRQQLLRIYQVSSRPFLHLSNNDNDHLR